MKNLDRSVSLSDVIYLLKSRSHFLCPEKLRQPRPCQWQPYECKQLSWSHSSAAALLFSRMLGINMLPSPILWHLSHVSYWWHFSGSGEPLLQCTWLSWGLLHQMRGSWTPVWPAHCQHCWSYSHFKIVSQDSNVEVQGHPILNSSSFADSQRNSQKGVSICSICLYHQFLNLLLVRFLLIRVDVIVLLMCSQSLRHLLPRSMFYHCLGSLGPLKHQLSHFWGTEINLKQWNSHESERSLWSRSWE